MVVVGSSVVVGSGVVVVGSSVVDTVEPCNTISKNDREYNRL